MNTNNFLLEKYGPLIPLEALAHLLDRSPQGLRVSLHSQNPLSEAVNSAKCKIGRRVYFRTESIAKMIDDEAWRTNEY